MVENFKSVIFSIIALGILFFIGYWAFTSIESGSDHVKNQELKELKNANEELGKENTRLQSEISLLNAQKEEQAIEATKEVEKEVSEPTTTASKHQDLIDDLQGLVDKGVFLKRKSQGPSVGIVQEFLNIYNKTSAKIDNDFGASTETAVKSFQKAVGLTADGQVGKSTFLKMIEWLKKQ